MPVRRILLFGLVPAFAVAIAVLLVGINLKQPRLTARAVVTVDWNLMPSVPNDKEAEKLRAEWRSRLTDELIHLPNSDAELADILESVNALSNSPNTNRVLVSELKRGLRITLLKQTAECDQFSIEVQNNNTNFAYAAAQCMVPGITSKIKNEARIAGGVAALSSYSNVAHDIQRREFLKTERERLRELGSYSFDHEPRQRLAEIDAEINKLESSQMESAFGMLGNAGHVFFTDPVKVVEQVHLEKKSHQSGLGILVVAAILGCAAGMGGLVLHKLTSAKEATAPPRIPPPIPSTRSQNPPFLPPPIPASPRLN